MLIYVRVPVQDEIAFDTTKEREIMVAPAQLV